MFVIDDAKRLALDGTEGCTFYEVQNSSVFDALSRAKSGGKVPEIIRTHVKDYYAKKYKIKELYETKTNMISLETDL